MRAFVPPIALLLLLGAGCKASAPSESAATTEGGGGATTVSAPDRSDASQDPTSTINDAGHPPPRALPDAATDAAAAADARVDAGSLPPLPCEITAEDDRLPGVRLHVEGDLCRVETAQAHEFRYRVEVDNALAYTVPDTFNGCGRCGGYSDDPRSLVDFSIGADDVWYCVCDQGCCPPTISHAETLQTGAFDGVIDWPGLQWRGPSDTSEPLGHGFPAGAYAVSVTFSVPGIGAITARLPIEVYGDPGPVPASCEVGGVIYASGQNGIGDPQSCNTCSCDDGQLTCTDIGCPEPCPSGTAYGTSCSQCGPSDACEVVRHDCLPTCTTSTDCATAGFSLCSDGVCKDLCG